MSQSRLTITHRPFLNRSSAKQLTQQPTCRTLFLSFPSKEHPNPRPSFEYHESWTDQASLDSLLSSFRSFWTPSFISLLRKYSRPTLLQCFNAKDTAFVECDGERGSIALDKQPLLVPLLLECLSLRDIWYNLLPNYWDGEPQR